MRTRLFDFVTVAVSLLAIGAASVFAYAGSEKNPSVVIKSGEAYVLTSPCPNKLCILQGKISRPGQWIACLPNQVFLHVSGREENPVDEVSY